MSSGFGPPFLLPLKNPHLFFLLIKGYFFSLHFYILYSFACFILCSSVAIEFLVSSKGGGCSWLLSLRTNSGTGFWVFVHLRSFVLGFCLIQVHICLPGVKSVNFLVLLVKLRTILVGGNQAFI